MKSARIECLENGSFSGPLQAIDKGLSVLSRVRHIGLRDAQPDLGCGAELSNFGFCYPFPHGVVDNPAWAQVGERPKRQVPLNKRVRAKPPVFQPGVGLWWSSAPPPYALGGPEISAVKSRFE